MGSLPFTTDKVTVTQNIRNIKIHIIFSLHQIVHDAEAQLECARVAAEEARKKLNEARLQLRLKRKEFKNGI